VRATLEGWARSPHDAERGELVLIAGGRRLVVETGMWPDVWDALVRGGSYDVTLELDYPTTRPGGVSHRAGRSGPRLRPLDPPKYLAVGRVVGVEFFRRSWPDGSVEGSKIGLDVGLPAPIVAELPVREARALRPHEVIGLEGVLCGRLARPAP
jgi:hypothetical protein